MSRYLHYYFADYLQEDGSVDMAAFGAAKQNELIGQLAQKYSNKLSALSSAAAKDSSSLEEATSLLDFMTSDAAKSEFQSAYESYVAEHGEQDYSALKKSSYEDMTYKQLNEAVRKDAENITIDLRSFRDNLQKQFESMYRLLAGNEANASKYKKAVLEYYKETQQIPGGDSEVASRIIQDCLNKASKGLSTIKEMDQGRTSDTLRSVVNEIALAINALDIAVNGVDIFGGEVDVVSRNNSDTVTGQTKILGALAGKISGWVSNVKGAGNEIAWEEAAKEGMLKIIEKQKEINESVEADMKVVNQGGSKNPWITISGAFKEKDKQLSENYDKSSVAQAKSDVAVYVSEGNVELVFGFNVKNYTVNTSTGVANIALVKETPFLSAAEKLFGGADFGYMMNLAAGHAGKGYHANASASYSDSALNSAWGDLVQCVVLYNFVDYISGTITTDTAVYLAVNNKLYTVQEVLADIASGKNKIISTLEQKGSTKTIQRSTLRNLNKWAYRNGEPSRAAKTRCNTEKANERSENAWTEIDAQLQKASLKVDLSVIASLLKN